MSDSPPMLSHVGIRVKNFEAGKAFYSKTLAPLGYKLFAEFPNTCGFGAHPPGMFWVSTDERTVGPSHVAFNAPNPEAVKAFHAAALAAGAKDNGAPGFRPQYNERYYAAFIIDPDGHNLEAVCMADPK